MFPIPSLLTVLLLSVVLQMAKGQTIRYVMPMPAGAADGSSWGNASADLQLMINESADGDEVWVAAGTYVPNRPVNDIHTLDPMNRDNAFLIDGKSIGVYGGFAGGETDRADRDIAANETILSGDFNANGYADPTCAYHVVAFRGDADGEVDGFTIKHGHAEGSLAAGGFGQSYGGGLYIFQSSPTLRNLVIKENVAGRGAGVYLSGSGAVFERCEIISNTTQDFGNGTDGPGGGVYTLGQSGNFTLTNVFRNVRIAGNNSSGMGGGVYLGPYVNIEMTNVLITGNQATESRGGGIYVRNIYGGWLTNVTVYGNHATGGGGRGGGIDGALTGATADYELFIRNSIICGNVGVNLVPPPADEDGSFNITHSIVEGGYTGVGNMDTDPLLIFQPGPYAAPTLDGDFRLSPYSAAINAGSNAYYAAGQVPDLAGVTTDLDGNPRQFDSEPVDMGAYEFQGSPPAPRPFITTWKTDNPGTSADNQISIPIVDTGYDMTIDWGDGTTTTWQDGDNVADLTHTYATAGTYDVGITGDFPRIYFYGNGDRQKILDVKQWGDIAWKSMELAFSGANELEVTATDAPDLSDVVSMARMFQSASKFNSNIEHWDVSTIEDMTSLFNSAVAYNQPLNAWDVSNVTKMAHLFNFASQFDQPLNDWDVSNVKDMSGMFANTSFNQPIADWEVGQVENMLLMFASASLFNADIAGWDVSSVTDMGQLFQSAHAFNQDIGGWDVSNVTNMHLLFFDAGMSTANYDATLIGWAGQAVQPSLTLNAHGLTYCLGEAARQSLIDNHGWVFEDDSKALDCADPGPVLVAPADGSADLAQPVTLEWEAVDGATSYFIQVIEVGGDFGSPYFSGTTASTSRELTMLPEGGEYLWRVQAVVGGQISAWSETWSFSTLTALPEITGIVFVDDWRTYDGNAHAIFIEGTLPDEVEVTYTGNGQVNSDMYTVTAYLDGGGVYEDKEMTAVLTINRAPSVITALPVQTHAYDGTNKIVVASLNHSEAVLNYDPTDRFNQVGEYDVTVSVEQSTNYEAASVNVQLVIQLGQQQNLAMASRVITYDGEEQFLFVTGAAPDAVISYVGNNQRDVGEYEVTATVTRVGFEPKVLEGTLTITSRNVAITIGQHEKVYGDTDPVAYTYMVTNGSLVAGDEPAGSFAREPGENVQVYPIRQGSFTFGDNYNLIVNQGYLRIVRAPSVITADAIQTFTYDGELHQVVAALNHDQAPLIFMPVERGYAGVGEYDITVRVNQSANYEATNITVRQIIEPAEQTGDMTLPSRTVTYNGGTHSLAVENLPGEAAVTYVNNGQTNTGTYTVTATVTQPGYADVELTGTLTIQRATAVITADAVQIYPYTGSEIGVQATLNHDETGFIYTPVSGYTNPGNYNITVTAPQTDNYTTASRTLTLRIVPAEELHLPSATVVYTGEPQYLAVANLPAGADVTYTNNGQVNVGVYPVTAIVSLPGEPDEAFEATLTIARATPIITAETVQEHTYDGTVKEVVASLDHDEVELDYLPAKGYTLPGTYEIAVRAMQSENYTTAFRNVQLVIHPLSASGDYTMASRTITYDGQPHGLTVENLPDDATVAYDINEVVDVGVYTITATVSRPGYTTETLNGVLTIERAAAVIAADAMQAHSYDGTAKSVVATLNHNEVELAYSPAVSFTDAGTYTVTVTAAQSTNYTAASAVVTLVITEATAPGVDPVFEGRTVTYDGAEHRLEVTNLPEGATVVYANNGHTNAGVYTVTANVTLADNSTREFTAVLAIEKATTTNVTFADGTFTYDGMAKSLALAGTLPAGTDVTYANNSRVDAGSQPVTATVSGANYESLVLTAELTVTPAAVSGITLADGSFTYDGTAKSLALAGTLPAGTDVTYANNSRVDAGSQPVTATVSGANYESLVLTAELTVTPATRSLSFPEIAAKTMGDDDFAAGAAASSGELILYASSNERVAVVENGIIRLVGAGTTTITATVAPHANYSNTPVAAQRLIVAKGQQVINFGEVGQVDRNIGSVSLQVGSSSGLPVTLLVDDEQVAQLEGSVLNILRIGTVRITATQAGNESYEAAQPVTITARVVDSEAEFPVRIHQAVSPNGDGVNEFLMIEGIRDYPENRVTIFNRNGTIVYEVSGYDNGLRSFKGKGSGLINLPAGTYFCIVEIKEGADWRHHKGYFVLRY